jgi:electron transfer flavoprotein beta subunit
VAAPPFKILVPIKQVIDAYARVRIKPDHTGVDTANVKLAMNPFCLVAVEEAIRIRETGKAGEVVVVTAGSERAREVLVTALAMGADRTIHLHTDGDIQPPGVARLLAHVVVRESPRLIILGKQAIDDDNNQTGQMLAGLLGWPQATSASRVEFDDDRVIVTREIDGGTAVVALRLPALISAELRLNEPRYTGLTDMVKARKKPVEDIKAADLGLNNPPALKTLRVDAAPPRKPGLKVASVSELIDKLRNEAKVI